MVQAVKNNPWNTIDLVESLLEQLRAKDSLSVTTQIEELKNLPPHLFPLTVKHSSELEKNQFKGMDLLEGWLIVPSSDTEISWRLNEFHENVKELSQLCHDLHSSIEAR